MKITKKLLAIILSLCMIIGMCLTGTMISVSAASGQNTVAGSLPEGSTLLTAGWTASDYAQNVSFAGLNVGQPFKWMDGQIYKYGTSGEYQDNWFESDPSEWWVAVDLGAQRTITGFKMYSDDVTKDFGNGIENDGPVCDMAFYGRNDTTSEWTLFATLEGNTENECTASFVNPVEYRYVKFQVTKHRAGNLSDEYANNVDKWYNLAEVELYGEGSGIVPPTEEYVPADTTGLFRINDLWSSNYWYKVEQNSARVTSNDNLEGGERIYHIFDGNNAAIGDSWIGTKEHPENFWAAIDLGGTFNLKAFNFIAYTTGDGDAWWPVTRFEIYTTTDSSIDENTVWNLAANVANKTQKDYIAEFENTVEARFVKVAIKNTMGELGGKDWVCIPELELFADLTDNKFMATAGEIPEESVNLTEEWTSDDYSNYVNAGVNTWMDGNISENWQETWNQYIEVDLRTAEPTLTGFKLFSKPAGVDGITESPIYSMIFYGRNSKDDKWEPFASYGNNTANELTAVFADTVKYRFVRFVVTRQRELANTLNPDHHWLCIEELQLFGIHGGETQDELTSADVEATGRWLTRGWGEAKIQSSITTSGNGNINGWFNGVTGSYNDMQCSSDGKGGWNDYAIVDLGGATQLTGYILYTNPQFAINAYSFYGSNDGIDFEPILAVVGATGATQFALFEGTPTYRYVKFKVDVPNNAGNEWLNLDEVKLFGNVTDEMMAATGSWITENWGKEKLASSVYANGSAWDFDKAFDTYIDADNRVNFEKHNPEFVIDLGKKTDLTGYSLFGNNSFYIVSYTFYGRNSENDEWEEFCTVTDSDRANRSDYFGDASYRYVKMVITNPNPTNYAHWWIEIWELKLYGNAADGEESVLGDVRGDGEVNILDLVRMKKIVTDYTGIDENGTVIRGKYAANFDVSDMNYDNTLNSMDLVELRKALFV